MPRISMKLTASVIGSLALLLAACERRTENAPQPAPGTPGAQEPNSMQPTPGTPSPGGQATPGNAPPNQNPSAAAPAENPDTVPVRGTEPDTQGAGGASASGKGGQGGHSGHGNK
jgi:hypothetical protein